MPNTLQHSLSHLGRWFSNASESWLGSHGRVDSVGWVCVFDHRCTFLGVHDREWWRNGWQRDIGVSLQICSRLMSEESRIQCCPYVVTLQIRGMVHVFLLLGLANIPSSIVELAQTKALAFERWVTLKRILLTLKKVTEPSEEQDLLAVISQLKLNWLNRMDHCRNDNDEIWPVFFPKLIENFLFSFFLSFLFIFSSLRWSMDRMKKKQIKRDACLPFLAYLWVSWRWVMCLVR